MGARIALLTLVGTLVALSSWAIVDRSLFLYQLWRSASANSTSEILIDLRVMSALSALLLNFVPIGLAIGLYQRASWARTLAIVLSSSILIPSVLAEIGILRDPTPMKPYNWLIISICAVASLVLINPHIQPLFQRQK